MSDTYRVGRTLGTTIYRNDEKQPMVFVVNMPDIEACAIAARILDFLNAEPAPSAAVEGPKECCGLCGGNGICPCVSRDKRPRHACGRCNGTGIDYAAARTSEAQPKIPCPRCAGKGEVTTYTLQNRDDFYQIVCPLCDGRKFVAYEAPKGCCGGGGYGSCRDGRDDDLCVYCEASKGNE